MTSLFFRGLLCLFCISAAVAHVPGPGVRIDALSDDFEDTSWSFNRTTNQSSNGKWTSSYRGAPEILRYRPAPEGGVSGQIGSLQIRSYDNDNDGYPQQEDMVMNNHAALYGRYLQRADMPSFMAHIYMPAYSSMQKEWSTLGFRIDSRSNQLDSGLYYPSIWLQYANNNFGVVVRMGDGYAADQYLFSVGDQNYTGGWVTVGISFDELGIGHYYFKQGVESFVDADKIYDTTLFPGGSNAKMDWIAYNFISIGYNANDPDISPDYRIGDVSAYIIPEPSTIGLLALGLLLAQKK